MISGGQYSLLRLLMGLVAAGGFVLLIAAPPPDPLPLGWRLLAPEGQPDWVLDPVSGEGSLLVARGAQVLGAVLGLLLALGWRARISSLLLAALWGAFQGFWLPAHGAGSAALFAWILALQACVPPAPYGSLAARGRPDPGGGWSLPRALPPLLALLYLAHMLDVALALRPWSPGATGQPGWSLLGLPLLAVPLLMAATRTRPLGWALGGTVLGLVLFLQGVPLLYWLPLQLLVFDARWLPAGPGSEGETLLYDGHCALCHGTVRFLLAEDRRARPIRFATLQGEHCASLLDDRTRETLPDSVVLLESDGSLHVRSEGVLRLLRRMGGAWSLLAGVCLSLPRPLRDRVYDLVSASRYGIFGRQDRGCPIMPRELRSRFLD